MRAWMGDYTPVVGVYVITIHALNPDAEKEAPDLPLKVSS